MGSSLAALGFSTLALAAAAPPQIDVSRAPGPQTEASIAIDPTDPQVLLAASQNPYACGIRVYGSSDAGRTWTSSLLPSPDAVASRKARGQRPICAGNEWVGIDRQGRQYVVYGAYVAAVSLGGPTLLIASRPSRSAPWGDPVQIDPTEPGTADKPMLTVDNSAASPHAGRLYVAWTRGFNPQRLVLSHSDDAGGTWSAPTLLGQGWGVHLATASDGTLLATWWSSTGSLLLTRSSDGGDHFSSPTAFASFLDLPQLGVSTTPAEPAEPLHPDPSLDVDRSPSSYRGRAYTVETRPTARGRRVYVTAFGPAANVLFTKLIGVTRLTRDDFNATVAVDQSSGTVWTCFYRTGTGAKRDLATYTCTTSRDGGRTWATPIAAASVPSNERVRGAFTTPTGVDSGFASYDGLAVADGIAHPIWTDTRDLRRRGEEIYTTRLVAR